MYDLIGVARQQSLAQMHVPTAEHSAASLVTIIQRTANKKRLRKLKDDDCLSMVAIRSAISAYERVIVALSEFSHHNAFVRE